MSDQGRVLSLVKRFGWNATSFQVLEPDFRYWFDGLDGEACVAYVDTGRAWVAAGAPIAPPARLSEVAHGFIEAGRSASRRVCFFYTEERFLSAVRLPAVQVGVQPVWDPRRWEESLAASRSLREQLRRARAKGVAVRRASAAALASPASHEARAIQELVRRWRRSREMAPMGFLVQLHLSSFTGERRCLLAEREGALVGLLSAVPVYMREGWLFEDLIRAPDAPNGTAELLIHTAMQEVAAEGSQYVTLGLAPLAGEVGRWHRLARAWSAGLYDFRGLYAFKEKLRPHRWDAIYLSYAPGCSALGAHVEVLRAFARGGFLRFGLETLLRGPVAVVRALAVLLVPWTALLASVDTARWFPSGYVHGAWVAFDVGLALGLFSLVRRWRQGLARALAGLVALDAVLTWTQALLFNLPRAASALERSAIGAAVAAPTLAAVLLFRACARRQVAPRGR